MKDAVRVSGVVMTSSPVGDYDRRLVLLTRERGKVTAFVRGARRAKSPFLAASRPFAFGEFELREGREAYTLVGTDMKRYFEELSTDVEMVSYACYFMEVANYYARENVEAAEQVSLVYFSFCALLRPALSNSLIRSIYEFRSMVLFGEYPNVFQCQHCKETLERQAWLCVERNGVYCEQHHSMAKGAVKLLAGTLYTLQYVAAAPIERLYTFQVSDEVERQFRQVVDSCCRKYINRQFSSLRLLREL